MNFLSNQGGTIFFSFALGVGGTGFLVWLLKNSLLAQLKLSLERQVEDHKHQLDLVKEQLKMDFQKEMLVYQALCREKFEIFPELHLNLLKSHGHIDGLLGVAYSPSWAVLSDEEVTRLFEERNGSSQRVDAILATRVSNIVQGNSDLGEYYRILDYRDARSAIQECKNFVLKNSLFMPPDLYESSWKCAVELSNALVDIEMIKQLPKGYENAKAHIESATSEKENVKKIIQRELGAA